MWLLVLLVAVVLLLLLRRPGGGAVGASALNSVREADTLVVGAWRKLEALIDATPNPDVTCARMLAGKKQDLPSEIVELWAYIDDLSERSNRRAEHYESVVRQPAPAMSGRAVSETVMASIRRRAARADATGPAPLAKPPSEAATRGRKADGDDSLHPDALEAYQSAKRLMAARGLTPDRQFSPHDILTLADESKGLTKLALQLVAMHASVLTGAVTPEKAISLLKEQRAYFAGLRDMGDDAAKRLLDPTLALYALFLTVIEKHQADTSKAGRRNGEAPS